MPAHRFFTVSCFLLTAALAAVPAGAAFHLWSIAEVYSSADGTVQFIELLSSGSAETQAAGAQIRTDSGNTFTIANNLSGNTLNDRLLFATADFHSLPGAPAVSATQPVYTIPANFFNPTSDRIRLFSTIFGEFHSRTINATTPIPTDNVFSRTYSGAMSFITANSPQARDVAAGSINRGDYNGDGKVDAADYVVWRKTFNEPVSPAGRGADGDTDGVVDDGDLAVWTMRFGNEIVGVLPGSGGGQGGATPEPSSLALLVIAFATQVSRRIGR